MTGRQQGPQCPWSEKALSLVSALLQEEALFPALQRAVLRPRRRDSDAPMALKIFTNGCHAEACIGLWLLVLGPDFPCLCCCRWLPQSLAASELLGCASSFFRLVTLLRVEGDVSGVPSQVSPFYSFSLSASIIGAHPPYSLEK